MAHDKSQPFLGEPLRLGLGHLFSAHPLQGRIKVFVTLERRRRREERGSKGMYYGGESSLPLCLPHQPREGKKMEAIYTEITLLRKNSTK
jgi:hypothetical protein